MSPHVWMGKNISAGMLGLYSASLKQVNGCRVVSEREWHILTPKTWGLAKCWGKWLCWCQCSSAGIQWEQLQDRLQSVGVLEQATRWWQGPCIVVVEEGVAVILIRGAVQGCVWKVCNFCIMHSLSYILCNTTTGRPPGNTVGRQKNHNLRVVYTHIQGSAKSQKKTLFCKHMSEHSVVCTLLSQQGYK